MKDASGRKGEDRKIRLLTGLAVFLVAAIILMLIAIWKVALAPQPQPTPAATETADETLTMQADVEVNRDLLFGWYDLSSLQTLDGQSVTIPEDRPLLLLFWSSWCEDCEAFFEDGLSEAERAAGEAGAELWLVCRGGVRGETVQTAQAAAETLDAAYTVVMDKDAALYQSLTLNQVPSVALFGAQGHLMGLFTEAPDAEMVPEWAAYAGGGAAAQSEKFVQSVLTGGDGGVASYYEVSGSGVPAREEVYLSETQGLVMQYALNENDKAGFDSAYAFVREQLTHNGYAAWRKADGEQSNVNAALDDLRILDRLLQANDRWSGYQQDIFVRERALYACVNEYGALVDFVDMETGDRATSTALCYLDIAALERLAVHYARWQAVADSARQILQAGIISDAFPLYYPQYFSESGTYGGERLQMNEAMVAVLNAVEAGVAEERTLDFLQAMLQDGPIYAAYDLSGEVVPSFAYESTATYALLARVGLLTGRDEMTQLALARMERQRVFTGDLCGSYGAQWRSTHYTFDTLQAMLTWQQATASARETNQ